MTPDMHGGFNMHDGNITKTTTAAHPVILSPAAHCKRLSCQMLPLLAPLELSLLFATFNIFFRGLLPPVQPPGHRAI